MASLSTLVTFVNVFAYSSPKKSSWAKIVKKTQKNGRVDHVQPQFSTPSRREHQNFMNVSDGEEPVDYFKH